ncbi:MAG: DUF4349 domain-containing protein [Methanospirillum sp.]
MQRIAAVLALVLLLAAAGCTSTAPQDLKYSNSGTVGGPIPADRSVASGEAVAPGTALTAAPADPKLIRNADLRVEVPSLEPAIDRVREVAADQNGTVAGLELRAESGDRRTATVTVRVPEDRFDATLGALRAVGTVRSESVQAQDVTEEYVDLAAKQDSLSRQLDQYHRIMANTTGVDQVLKVQEEIERVQLELDRTAGRLRYLESRTSYSRVTLRLEEPAPLVGGTLPSITGVIGAGVQGFFAVLSGLVILVITVLPLALVGGAAWFLYRRYRRSRA